MEPATTPTRTKAQERVAKGLCPRCGEEAAPYYLCHTCRQRDRTMRTLKRGLKTETFIGEKKAGQWLWRNGPGPVDNRWSTKVGTTPEEDRRFAPRVKGLPVDLEKELHALLHQLGDVVKEDEVVRAWGRLRGEKKRKHGSAAGDLRALILAERRRNERAARRLA